jgi:P27 family predicted phage terminase small subunit
MSGTKNSGRRSKSTQAHVLQGTFRKDRHGDGETPEPPIGRPKPPKQLNAEARAEWDRMVERLDTTRTLSIVDDGALYQYAKLFAETEATEADQKENRRLAGLLKRKMTARLDGARLIEAIKAVVGLRQMINKGTRDLRQQRMALRQYLVEFGMTPSARSRVKLPGKRQPVDPVKERFFGGSHSGTKT